MLDPHLVLFTHQYLCLSPFLHVLSSSPATAEHSSVRTLVSTFRQGSASARWEPPEAGGPRLILSASQLRLGPLSIFLLDDKPSLNEQYARRSAAEAQAPDSSLPSKDAGAGASQVNSTGPRRPARRHSPRGCSGAKSRETRPERQPFGRGDLPGWSPPESRGHQAPRRGLFRCQPRKRKCAHWAVRAGVLTGGWSRTRGAGGFFSLF